MKTTCPKCGHRYELKKIMRKIASKGGSVSSEAKRLAAKEREARKRDEKAKG